MTYRIYCPFDIEVYDDDQEAIDALVIDPNASDYSLLHEAATIEECLNVVEISADAAWRIYSIDADGNHTLLEDHVED